MTNEKSLQNLTLFSVWFCFLFLFLNFNIAFFCFSRFGSAGYYSHLTLTYINLLPNICARNWFNLQFLVSHKNKNYPLNHHEQKKMMFFVCEQSIVRFFFSLSLSLLNHINFGFVLYGRWQDEDINGFYCSLIKIEYLFHIFIFHLYSVKYIPFHFVSADGSLVYIFGHLFL